MVVVVGVLAVAGCGGSTSTAPAVTTSAVPSEAVSTFVSPSSSSGLVACEETVDGVTTYDSGDTAKGLAAFSAAVGALQAGGAGADQVSAFGPLIVAVSSTDPKAEIAAARTVAAECKASGFTP